MSKKKKGIVEYRHYEIPNHEYVIALLGENWVRAYGALPNLHIHNHLEIGYCFEGEGEVVFNGKSMSYEGGMFTIIPKNYPHTTNSREGNTCKWEYLFVDVDKLLALTYSDNKHKIDTVIERINHKPCILYTSEQTKMGMLICDILEEMRNKKKFYKETVHSELFVLLAEFARINEVDIPEQEIKVTNESAIYEAIDYISVKYASSIKIAQLADYCHMSETHFRRKFSENIGTSPIEYINHVRIRASCHSLKATRDSIEDIAAQCGYSSASTFYRNFQKVMGVSPKEWRKKSEHYEQKMLDVKIDKYEGW